MPPNVLGFLHEAIIIGVGTHECYVAWCVNCQDHKTVLYINIGLSLAGRSLQWKCEGCKEEFHQPLQYSPGLVDRGVL